MAGEMSAVARGYVQIRVDQSKMPGDLARVTSMFKQSLANMAGVTGGILAAAGIRGLGDAIRAVGGHFMQASTLMENFTISLGVLLKSEEKAKNLMAEVEKFAAVTPFTTQSLAQAITQLKIYGFETQKLIPMAKSIGDAAAASPMGMAEGLQRISYALGQINTAGKVSRRELRQLTMAGVAGFDMLAAKLGKSKAQISDMVKGGMISAKVAIGAILEGMDKQFGGMMKKQSRTWVGLWSTLTDNLRIFSRQAGEPIFDVAKSGLQAVVDFFETDTAKKWIADIKSGITYVISLVKGAMKSSWLPVVVKIAEAANTAALLGSSIGLATAAAKALHIGISDLLSPFGLLTAGATALLFAFKEALDGPHGEQLKSTLNEIWETTKQISFNLKVGFKNFLTWLDGAWAASFGGTLVGTSDRFFQGVLDWVKRASEQVKLFTSDFGISWQMIAAKSNIAWLDIQGQAVGAFDKMKEYISPFVAAMKEASLVIGEDLKAAFKAAMDWVSGYANAYSQGQGAMFRVPLENKALSLAASGIGTGAEGPDKSSQQELKRLKDEAYQKAFNKAMTEHLNKQQPLETVSLAEAKARIEKAYKGVIDPLLGQTKEEMAILDAQNDRLSDLNNLKQLQRKIFDELKEQLGIVAVDKDRARAAQIAGNAQRAGMEERAINARPEEEKKPQRPLSPAEREAARKEFLRNQYAEQHGGNISSRPQAPSDRDKSGEGFVPSPESVQKYENDLRDWRENKKGSQQERALRIKNAMREKKGLAQVGMDGKEIVDKGDKDDGTTTHKKGGGHHGSMGLLEFAAAIQTSLNESEADKAAINMDKNIQKIVDDGVKIAGGAREVQLGLTV